MQQRRPTRSMTRISSVSEHIFPRNCSENTNHEEQNNSIVDQNVNGGNDSSSTETEDIIPQDWQGKKSIFRNKMTMMLRKK